MTNLIATAVAIALSVEGGSAASIGDGGRAVGYGQMWPVAVAEANRIIGTNRYTLADRSDLAKVYEMATITLTYHHKRHPCKGVVWLAERWRTPYRYVAKTKGDVRHRKRLIAAAEKMGVSALDIRNQ